MSWHIIKTYCHRRSNGLLNENNTSTRDRCFNETCASAPVTVFPRIQTKHRRDQKWIGFQWIEYKKLLQTKLFSTLCNWEGGPRKGHFFIMSNLRATFLLWGI